MNRSVSVDFYRGMTVAFMIVVNTPGAWDTVYAPLQHAAWHGCTPTDLVFPSFMFIIGVSMWFAFERYGRVWSAEVGKKILRRTLLLFLIGLVLNKFPFLWRDWDTWRIMGVPQRLALGYGLASVMVLTLSRKMLIWFSVFLLMLYWALLFYCGVPGADPYAMDTNAVLRLDRFLFTDAHLWHGERIPFDPEGLLSTIPSVVTVVLGWLSGNLMGYRKDQLEYLVRDLLALGVLCAGLGLFWDLLLPINKKLWTSSYVLYAGGVSMVLLALSVWLIDMRKWKSGTGFFLAFGANALFAYVFSEALIALLFAIDWTRQDGTVISAQQWIYRSVFFPLEGAAFSSLLFALAYTMLCWALNRYLYSRHIYIKL